MTLGLALMAVAAGLGATLLLAGLLRKAADTYIVAGRAYTMPDVISGARAFTDRARRRISGELQSNSALQQDCAMIGRASETHALIKLSGLVGGTFLVLVAGIVLTAALGVTVPVPFIVMAAAVAALGGWWLPDSMLKTEAEAERERFRQTSEAWLELVAQLVTAGADTHAALGTASDFSSQPGFVTLRDALAEAAARGEAPWDGLRRLVESHRLKSLDPFVSALELAGTSGASARQAILSQVEAARTKSLAAADAKAASASETMGGPLALIGGAFMIMMGYPPLAGIMDSGATAGF